MARLARVVVPETPHHITQRGNRRQQTFFVEADDRTDLDLAPPTGSRRWKPLRADPGLSREWADPTRLKGRIEGSGPHGFEG